MVFLGGFVRGLGWAGVNTGGYTVLATTAPPERRGEAAGYYTGATSGASIIFPMLGLWLIEHGAGAAAVFIVSVVAPVVGIAFTIGVSRSAGGPPPRPAAKPAAGGALFDRGVLIATGLNLCSTLAMPSVMAFLPLYARSLDIANIGLFYAIAGITNIFVRPLLGKWSDAMGRGPAVALGLSAQLAGLALIISAQGLALIVAGGVFVAIGMAMIGATTTALAMDLSDTTSRGRAMATYSISYQLGAGIGAIIAGALADLVGLRGMYFGSAAITVCGLIILAFVWRQLPKPSR
jgi:MFS family permease